ncbi:MAG: hypothetical protein K2K42_02085, partial [Eubacterium sp.]|nr:hypothetical protein [Eubacterium sp.]
YKGIMMKHKKERYTLIPLFEKRVSEFVYENYFENPVYSFDEKTGEYTASVNRGLFTMLFRYYPDNESSIFQIENKTKGIVLNSFIPFRAYNKGNDAERFDSLRVLYVFNDKEPYYCLHDIFNIFDIKDFSGCEQHCIFGERTLNKAFDQLFSDVLRYDDYVVRVSESEELQEKLFYNFKCDVETLIPSWDIKDKTIAEQREKLDSVLAENTAIDMAGYNKCIYHGLPEKALKCFYKEDKKGKLTIFEKRYCRYIEENLDSFRERKQTDFAKASSFCRPVKYITGVVFIPLIAFAAYFVIELINQIIFGSKLAFIEDMSIFVVGLMAMAGLLIGFIFYPLVVRLLLTGKKDKLNNAIDFMKYSFWERMNHKLYCIMSVVIVSVAIACIISCVINSPILGESYVEKVNIFSSENTQYAYDNLEYYVVAGYYEDDEEYEDDGTRELVLKLDDEDYYFTDWLYPNELEKYISRIEANGGTVRYKDNLEEIDEYFRSE